MAEMVPLTTFNVPLSVASAELFVVFKVIVPSLSVEEFSVASMSNAVVPTYFLPLTLTVPLVSICVAQSTTTVEFAAVSISSIALAEPLSLSVNLLPLTVRLASFSVGDVDLSKMPASTVCAVMSSSVPTGASTGNHFVEAAVKVFTLIVEPVSFSQMEPLPFIKPTSLCV